MRPLLNFCVAVVGAGVLAAFLAKFLPQTSLYRRLALVTVQPSGPAAARPDSLHAVQPGLTGVAKTTLRPSGKAEFGDHLCDVISDGAYIEAGSPVRVITVEGARVVVEPSRA